jgi:hypothetical protein
MTFHIKTAVAITATVKLTEDHLRALAALTAYGDDEFLKAFYAKLGTNYLAKHEKDLRDLFSHVRSVVSPALNEAQLMRERISFAQK